MFFEILAEGQGASRACRYDLPPPPESVRHQGLGSALTALADHTDGHDPYLLMGHHDGPCFVGRDVGVSQYYRREWARLLGRADKWDYLLTRDDGCAKGAIESFFSWKA